MGDKRLYKSSENSMLCGVCGGIAEYFDIDPTLVRLAWVILTCFGGAGIWAYIIAAIIIPKKITESQDPICNGQKFNRIRQAAKRIANIRLNEIQYKN